MIKKKLTDLSLNFQVIKRLTNGGADYSFECIGDTGMISTALQSCCDVISFPLACLLLLLCLSFICPAQRSTLIYDSQGWGLTVTLGVPKAKPEVSAHYGLFLSGRTLKGSLFGGWKPKSELPSLVDMYTRKVQITYSNPVIHLNSFNAIFLG